VGWAFRSRKTILPNIGRELVHVVLDLYRALMAFNGSLLLVEAKVKGVVLENLMGCPCL
jgi:hypothetical protein